MKLKSKSLPIGQCHMQNAWQETIGKIQNIYQPCIIVCYSVYFWLIRFYRSCFYRQHFRLRSFASSCNPYLDLDYSGYHKQGHYNGNVKMLFPKRTYNTDLILIPTLAPLRFVPLVSISTREVRQYLFIYYTLLNWNFFPVVILKSNYSKFQMPFSLFYHFSFGFRFPIFLVWSLPCWQWPSDVLITFQYFARLTQSEFFMQLKGKIHNLKNVGKYALLN